MRYLILIIFSAQLYVTTHAQTALSSLAELRVAVQQSNQEIVMAPGNYNLEDLPSDSMNITCSGSNNIINLTGVYVDVPVGCVRTSYILVTGNNNTIIGGEFEDTYRNGITEVTDFSAYNQDRTNLAIGLKGAAVMKIVGDDNLIDGIKLTVRGSFPYGYGSIYGIGANNVFGLDKRCGILITGVRNIIDNVELQQRAFGHGIYMQGDADDNLIRNTLVEGRVRPTVELYSETNSYDLPYRSDYKLPLEDNASIPKDEMLSLCEDGIRMYSGTKSVTVENCTVKKMRGGIRLYLGSEGTVSNSTSIDCGMTNWNMPSGGKITNSFGNFSYAPLSDFRLGRSNMDIEWTIIPSPHAMGPHNIADIQGDNHDIIFHRTPGPIDTTTRAIAVSGDFSNIVNESEYHIILESSANGNKIISSGPVTDYGNNNVFLTSDPENVCAAVYPKVFPPYDPVAGINYSYYEGVWDSIPNFSELTPIETGLAPNIDSTGITINGSYGTLFSGYIDIPFNGTFTYHLISDNQSRLIIDGVKVVDNDGTHGTEEVSGSICLKKGFHEFRVEYVGMSSSSPLSVTYEDYESIKKPLSNLYGYDGISKYDIAYDGTATQSSTKSGRDASFAIDGNTSGRYNDNSISNTETENDSWWQVDLGSEYNIGEINMFKQTDGFYAPNLKTFAISVLNDSGEVVFKRYFFETPDPLVSVNAGGIIGKIIKVQSIGNISLALAEVQVFEGSKFKKLTQTISFNTLPLLSSGDVEFDPEATASSGLPISYISSDSSVAKIVNGKVNPVGSGTALIAATQEGDSTYYAAVDSAQIIYVDRVSDVEEEEASTVIPVKFELHQNYPNPFNPSTAIEYSVAKPCNVKIEIFNSLGQKVATILDEYRQIGHHTVRFNADNLSSSLYFYTIKAEGFYQTKKMLLMK